MTNWLLPHSTKVYFTLPLAAAPTTNQILARHVRKSPTYNMLYKSYKHIHIYRLKKYAVSSFKRRSSPFKSKMDIMENKCANDHGKTARHVLQKAKSSNRQKPNAQNRSINFFPIGAVVEFSPFSPPIGMAGSATTRAMGCHPNTAKCS